MFPFQEFIQFATNPGQYLINKGINIPQNQAQNPDQIIQYMMNNGLLSQQQYNQAVNQRNILQKDPSFMQFINRFFPH